MSVKIERICSKHGLTTHHMYVKKNRHSSKEYKCMKCSTEAVARRRKKMKSMAVEYKGGKCQRCGYSKSLSALTFHHLDPNEKDFGISARGYTRSWEKVRIELDKCIMLCANCHAEEHERLDSKSIL